MTHDEGQIKYRCRWAKISATIPDHVFSEINPWRNYFHEMGLIGTYPDGIGFGNISVRADYSREFWISCSATGHLKILLPEHYARVTDFDIKQNKVWCWGENQASSEAMSHAVLYACDRRIKAIIHIHNRPLWDYLIHRVPTTAENVAYGTPEMADAIKTLYETTNLPELKIVVMAGHQDGIVAFGNNLDDAAKKIITQVKAL